MRKLLEGINITGHKVKGVYQKHPKMGSLKRQQRVISCIFSYFFRRTNFQHIGQFQLYKKAPNPKGPALKSICSVN